MSQQSVFKLLKKKKKWMTSKEIAKNLGLMSPHTALKQMYKYGEIIRRKIKINDNGRCYQYKIKNAT